MPSVWRRVTLLAPAPARGGVNLVLIMVTGPIGV
jgi:hypothetical protein